MKVRVVSITHNIEADYVVPDGVADPNVTNPLTHEIKPNETWAVGFMTESGSHLYLPNVPAEEAAGLKVGDLYAISLGLVQP